MPAAGGIRLYSTTAGSNNSTPPYGWPEGQAPATVNDCARQMMADVRSFCQDAEWFDSGDTPSRASATTFKVATDVTTRYLAGRRVKMFDTATYYGTVVSSSYSAPDTTITMDVDSGSSLTTSLTAVSVAILSPTNRALPAKYGRKGADIASASSIDLGAATGDFVDVTGTTAITALGTVDTGVVRTVRFTGILTLTHNGTSLILPTAANITTAANDRAIFRSLGSGNWVCIVYQLASGQPLVADSSLLLPTSDSNTIIKGSSDATKLYRFEVDGFTTGTTRVNTPPNCDVANHYLQQVSSFSSAVATGTTVTPSDDTIPQITEGIQFFTATITPKLSTSTLVIFFTGFFATSVAGSTRWIAALHQDATANALAAQAQNSQGSSAAANITLMWAMTSGTTSATTFTIRVGNSSAGTTTLNGQAGARLYGGAAASGIVVYEFA
jgi:hypothetical protein